MRGSSHTIFSRPLSDVLYTYDKGVRPRVEGAIQVSNEERGDISKALALFLDHIEEILAGDEEVSHEFTRLSLRLKNNLDDRRKDELTDAMAEFRKKSRGILDAEFERVLGTEFSEEQRLEWIERGCCFIHLCSLVEDTYESALGVETIGGAHVATHTREVVLDIIGEDFFSRKMGELREDVDHALGRLGRYVSYFGMDGDYSRERIISEQEFAFLDMYSVTTTTNHTPVPENPEENK